VHGHSVVLHIERLWSHNITLTTRLVDTPTVPTLLKMVISGKIEPRAPGSHHFRFAEIQKPYETLSNAAETGALKVILGPSVGAPTSGILLLDLRGPD
jgi:alcohol dehydrogenase